MSQSISNRIISLDALRGFTIAGMVIVNNPGTWGSVYDPLLHANWHGITPTDLIFPFFLFMVGVSISFAYTKRLAQGADKRALYKKVFVRSGKIMLIGWFLALFPFFDFANIRLAGVLPRISLVFLACACIFLNTRWKQQLWIAGGLLVGYWLLLAFVPVPIDAVIEQALATGTILRSGDRIVELEAIHQISDHWIAANYQPGINFAAWFDRMALPGRFWEITWDPEGLLSTVPAIGSGMLGMLVGTLYQRESDTYRKLTYLFFVGFVMITLGTIWGWFMPLNKNLWSSSYTLWTAGAATLGFAACILVVDVWGYTRWTQLGRVYGANAITSFVLSGLLTWVFYRDIWFGHSLSQMFMGGMTGLGVGAKFASMLYAVLYMLVIYLPAHWLYRKEIFIKV
ncbi:DUF5009 domain-containing protein [Pontibacter sp. G13]|uniref:acyltransferase family protein n=1 Tax=Pontibacter sp. G13 TaxID=3074898 RepID=UPI00288AB36A|nr:DUF5009 domain-containing protein [Pontibacter sp. G13]WNJ21325.1 DUF5009 domain-containing protein [Pontibacter sp. G13]